MTDQFRLDDGLITALIYLPGDHGANPEFTRGGLGIAVLFWLVLNRTRWGRIIRAAALDREMVGSLGINVSWLFTDRPFAERLKAVIDLGFEAVEFGFPSHADVDALASARQEFGLHVVMFNQDVPVWDAANRGYLADPARRGEFQARLAQALEIASRLGAEKIMLPAACACLS